MINSTPWYRVSEEAHLPNAVQTAMQTYKGKCSNRYSHWDFAELLLGTSKNDFGSSGGLWRSAMQFEDSRLKYSIIRSIRDAMKARLATRRPKVRAFTAGARYTVREKARLITKVIKGIFNRSDLYIQNHQIFNDVLDYGIGYAKPYEVEGVIKIDRVHPRCVIIDEPDYAPPTEWFQVEDVNKYELAEQYPEFEDEISRSTLVGSEQSEQDGDFCTVIEAWYTPASKQGRHCIVTSECVLVDDEWDSDKPGIVPVRFYDPSVGFVGDNLVDILGDIQYEIDYLLMRIQDHLDLGGTLKILVDASSQVNVSVLNNDLIQVIKHNGTKQVPIQVIQIPPIDPVYFQELDRLEQKAYNLVGLSELWSQSQKPVGLNSGRALSEMDDITSARFLHISQKEDDMYVRVAKACLTLADSINGFKIYVNGQLIPWSDIGLSEDEYDISIAPVSIVPDTSPGVIERIINDAQINPELAADQLVLFDSLDHEAYIRQLISPKLAVEKYLDEVLYDHKDSGLDDNLDLNYMQNKAILYYNQAYIDDDKKAQDMLLEVLSNIRDAQKRMKSPGPEQPMPGAPIPGPGPTQPGPMPIESPVASPNQMPM